MQGQAGVDYPEDRSPVDVLAASRGDAVISFVERIGADELVLTVGQDRAQRPVRLQPGERMDVVWKDAGELRSLPVELVAVETEPAKLWRVRAVGPATRGQRRAAVRAPLSYRAALEHGTVTAEGTTIDVSEGGVRALFEVTGNDTKVPEIADVVGVTVWFDERQHVTSRAEVTRVHGRTDSGLELSVRFIGLTEKMQDLIRREVFAGLRDLRARGLL
jgi:c-di-GMP-binding flagellar brake protein YcgR